jgi:hypothetical protein
MESQIGSRRKGSHTHNGKTRKAKCIEGLERLRKYYGILNWIKKEGKTHVQWEH